MRRACWHAPMAGTSVHATKHAVEGLGLTRGLEVARKRGRRDFQRGPWAWENPLGERRRRSAPNAAADSGPYRARRPDDHRPGPDSPGQEKIDPWTLYWLVRGRSCWWWRVKDSNLRRLSRRIYSPLPLAARATRLGGAGRADRRRGYTSGRRRPKRDRAVGSASARAGGGALWRTRRSTW